MSRSVLDTLLWLMEEAFDGDPSHSYGIEELPNLIIVPNGHETEIPMTGGTRLVTVFDRIDPAKKQSVELHAGQKRVVSLKSR